MIEVVTYAGETKLDRAEADSPEAAVLAARTLFADALTGGSAAGQARLRALFYVDGTLVREARWANL